MNSDFFPLRYDLGSVKPINWPSKQFNGDSLIFYRENYIPEIMCKEAVDYMDASNRLVPSLTNGVIDEVSRPNSFAMRGGQPVLSIYELACAFAKEHLDAMNIFSTFGTDGIKLHKTLSGGYFNWHADEGVSQYNTSRQFTLLIYLNDDFEGGYTEFLLQNIQVKPKTGLIIFYPSNMSHIHRGMPVTKGTKYLATVWVSQLIHNEE